MGDLPKDVRWPAFASCSATCPPKLDKLYAPTPNRGRLCVIDLDDPSQQSALEAQFPVLLNVPCERTKRGLHYFFARSPLCVRREPHLRALQTTPPKKQTLTPTLTPPKP